MLGISNRIHAAFAQRSAIPHTSPRFGGAVMKLNLKSMIKPDDPIMLDAIEALKRYHQALASAEPEPEIERLRIEAEQKFQSINEYQLAALGHQPLVRH